MKTRGLVGLVMLAGLSAAPAAAGWPPAAQREIVQDAIHLAPAELKTFLEAHRVEVLRGAEIPLISIKDFRNQQFHATAPAEGAVRKTAEHLQAAVAALKAKDDARAARQLGTASAYGAAVVQPRRFAGRETGDSEFSADAIPPTVRWPGFERPASLQDLLVGAGRWAGGVSQETQGEGDRYARAVTLVLETWLLAWLESGRTISGDLKAERAYKRGGTGEGAKPTVRAAGKFVIPFQKDGAAIFVRVTLNNKVPATFVLDTGATLVTISSRTARELGIAVTPDTQRITARTASGVITSPIVELESVKIGDAEATKVRAAVCDTCAVGALIEGLLGLSYLGQFNFSLDMERVHLVLETK